MGEPKILLRERHPKRGMPLAPAPDFGWGMLQTIGIVFILVGGLDIALAWAPLHFGSAEWEFGTVSATFDSLPLPTMGALFILAGAAAQGQRRMIRWVAGILVAVAGAVVLAGLLYATNIPLALHSAPNPVVETGLKKAVVKALGQMVLYPLAFVWIAWRAWRHTVTEQ
ncbi:MAG TPA: hypothetical protein VJ992_10255 [Gemmatimonadales bacterium]|nr:hypothetical protein [Gemmatimonadales bacterium]